MHHSITDYKGREAALPSILLALKPYECASDASGPDSMSDRSHKHVHHNHEQCRILVHRKSSGDVNDSKTLQGTVASDLSRFAPHSSPKSDPIAAKADGCEYLLGTKGHRTPEPSQRWQSYVLHREDALRPLYLQGLRLDALRVGVTYRGGGFVAVCNQ